MMQETEDTEHYAFNLESPVDLHLHPYWILAVEMRKVGLSVMVIPEETGFSFDAEMQARKLLSPVRHNKRFQAFEDSYDGRSPGSTFKNYPEIQSRLFALMYERRRRLELCLGLPEDMVRRMDGENYDRYVKLIDGYQTAPYQEFLRVGHLIIGKVLHDVMKTKP